MTDYIDELTKEIKVMNGYEDKPGDDEADAEAEIQSENDEAEHHHRRHHHHHSRQYYKKKKRKKRVKRIKKILIAVGIVLLAIVVCVAGGFYLMYHGGKQNFSANDYNIKAPENVERGPRGSYVVYNGEKYEYNKDIINILLIGSDKQVSAEEDKQIGQNHQADVLSLCAIDKAGGKINIINIPRDIMCDVAVYSPSGGYVGLEKMQIANSYAYGDGKTGSCMNSLEAVTRIFYNLPIKTFYALNLDGIAAINDSVGGVDVTSPETLFEFEKGKQYHLEGELATRFVRARVKDRADANLLRNERQKVYLNAFLKKFVSSVKQDVFTAVDLFNASAPYSCTNLNSDRITYLATEFVLNRNMQFQFVSVPVDVKQAGDKAENYIKETEFYEQFLSIFYKKVS